MNENNFFINYFVFKSRTLHSSLAFKNKAWLLSRTWPTVFKVSHIVQLLFQIHSIEKKSCQMLQANKQLPTWSTMYFAHEHSCNTPYPQRQMFGGKTYHVFTQLEHVFWWRVPQGTQKVVSDSPGLVEFAIGLVDSWSCCGNSNDRNRKSMWIESSLLLSNLILESKIITVIITMN